MLVLNVYIRILYIISIESIAQKFNPNFERMLDKFRSYIFRYDNMIISQNKLNLP